VPTPIGHALAGLTVAWAANAREPAPRRTSAARWTTTACVVAAIVADADIFFGTHRTWTHSLAAAIGFGMLAGLVAHLARRPVARTIALCTLAYVSHVALDWLGRDSLTPRGVMAFWPLTHTYYIAGVDLFSEVSRRYWKPDEFIVGNLWSVAREVAVLGPPALAAWWWRRRRVRALR
jgi:membrane-bound metal-dependent hydrolase YbcI (DUF457 family)